MQSVAGHAFGVLVPEGLSVEVADPLARMGTDTGLELLAGIAVTLALLVAVGDAKHAAADVAPVDAVVAPFAHAVQLLNVPRTSA